MGSERRLRRLKKLVFGGCGIAMLSLVQLVGQTGARTMDVPPPLQVENRSGSVVFDVASIRLNTAWKYTDPGYSLDSDEAYKDNNGLFLVDAPLTTLIAFAYKLDLQNAMITGLPKWTDGKSYEVRARVPEGATKDQVRGMMQTLLHERFHLALHFERKELPAYALTLVKPGKLGPRLSLHGQDDCTVSGSPPKAGGSMAGVNWLPCGVYLALNRPENGILAAARNTTMRQLGAFVSNVGGLGRPVVDGTGITSTIDFGVEYTRPNANRSDSEGATGESLVDGLRDQLGLKLVAVKARIPIPVVDSLEQLTDD